jgi:putative glutamine transport system permease protein
MYNLDFSVLLQDYKMILAGIGVTIFVSLLASIIAFLLGSVFVYYRTSPVTIVAKLSSFVANCIRNTPLLILIYLFYKGLPSVGVVMSPLTCGILALGIYSASYVSDAILSGVNAVPDEHFQAAKALGLSRSQSFVHVIYPEALRHSIYVLGSQFMNLVKNSSLVSFIAVTDIFYVVYKGIADSYRIYEYFLLAIVVYCSLTGFVLLLTNLLHRIFKIPSSEVRA